MELRSRAGGDCTAEWHATVPVLQDKYAGTFMGATKEVEEAASRYIFSSPSMGLCARTADCSICLAKPHCVAEGNLGAVTTDIIARGFAITGMRLLTLTKQQAMEFLCVYETVLPEKMFTDMVAELSSGPSVAIEVSGDAQVVQRLRALAGPIEFEFAKKLRPTSLRAKYGNSTKQSAVHVTDLAEDGAFESEYLFKILTGSAWISNICSLRFPTAALDI